MSGTVLSTLHVIIHFILIIINEVELYNYLEMNKHTPTPLDYLWSKEGIKTEIMNGSGYSFMCTDNGSIDVNGSHPS